MIKEEIIKSKKELKGYKYNQTLIQSKIEDLKRKKEKIEKKIDSIEQPYKNILYFRYIKGDSLTEVSNNIEKNYDYTRKLHRKALIKYGEIKDE